MLLYIKDGFEYSFSSIKLECLKYFTLKNRDINDSGC